MMSPAFLRQTAGLFVAGLVIGTSALLALPSVAPAPQEASPPPITAARTDSCGEGASSKAGAECRSIIEARRQRHDGWVAAIDSGDAASGDTGSVDQPDPVSANPAAVASPPKMTVPTVSSPSAVPPPSAAQRSEAATASAQKPTDAARGAAAKRRPGRERSREAHEARAQAQRHEWTRPPARARRPDQRRFERQFEPAANY